MPSPSGEDLGPAIRSRGPRYARRPRDDELPKRYYLWPMPTVQRVCITGLLLVALATQPMTAQATPFPTVGSIERLDPAIDALIPKNARIEKLADGFDWAEGPVWRSKD